ncbi:Hypothetical protein P9211_14501 [Prochlorococcus marinus str. MIT 9211]|uniref:Uncharacterized protein n=1 Tax=Prochlorococcus marinus (strain MIT 9211) TaxID=93059 RepID=A9BC19_PROM4|nr:Hypothetical protein P9211_14501 [Prochlorococcus marinus str. MIT 9211]
MINHYSSDGNCELKNSHLQKDGYRKRRQLEVKRRLSILQHKKIQLERELRTINSMLFSLNKQIESFYNYKKVSIKS